MAINEGPVILRRNGRVFMVYSASTTWSEDYSLGMLTMDENGDPMDPESWTKSMQPVFCKSVENGVYATGHNSFTQSPEGKEDWTLPCAARAWRRDGLAIDPHPEIRLEAGWNSGFRRTVRRVGCPGQPSGESCIWIHNLPLM